MLALQVELVMKYYIQPVFLDREVDLFSLKLRNVCGQVGCMQSTRIVYTGVSVGEPRCGRSLTREVM